MAISLAAGGAIIWGVSRRRAGRSAAAVLAFGAGVGGLACVVLFATSLGVAAGVVAPFVVVAASGSALSQLYFSEYQHSLSRTSAAVATAQTQNGFGRDRTERDGSGHYKGERLKQNQRRMNCPTCRSRSHHAGDLASLTRAFPRACWRTSRYIRVAFRVWDPVGVCGGWSDPWSVSPEIGALSRCRGTWWRFEVASCWESDHRDRSWPERGYPSPG